MSFTISQIKKAISKHNKEEENDVKVSISNGEIKFHRKGTTTKSTAGTQTAAPATTATAAATTASSKVGGHKKYLKEVKKKIKDLTPDERRTYDKLARASSREQKKLAAK